MRFILASNNKKKLKELSGILSDYGIEVIGQKDAGLDISPDETGATFEENALIKARAAASASGMPVVADDSGLETDALNGAPGIYSARYAEGSDEDRTRKLLDDMKDVPEEKRGARFVCALACALPDGREVTFRGECEGVITRKPEGNGGFGYDPVFFCPEHGMTFAQMPEELKNRISHRAKALKQFEEWIKGEME